MVSPEILALIAAVATVLTRELLAWIDRRDRQRGQKHTRHDDPENGQSTDTSR